MCALHMACELGNGAIVEALFSYAPDLSSRDMVHACCLLPGLKHLQNIDSHLWFLPELNSAVTQRSTLPPPTDKSESSDYCSTGE